MIVREKLEENKKIDNTLSYPCMICDCKDYTVQDKDNLIFGELNCLWPRCSCKHMAQDHSY